MPTIHLNPTGSDTGTGSVEQPFRTWSKVNPRLVAGVEVVAANGTYVDKPVFGASGTPDLPIRIRGAGAARIIGSLNLASRSHIEVEGVNLHSKNSGWWHMNAASESIRLHRMRLSSELVEADFLRLPYVGALLAGNNHSFTDSKIEDWYRGDALQVDCNYSLVQDIDCSECNAQHGVVVVKGSYNVIGGSTPERKMVITNRWDRPFEVMEFGSRGKAIGNLIQNLRIVNSNWDGSYPLPSIWAGGYVGGLQLSKAGGDSNIWREIEIEFNYVAGFVATQAYRGALQIGNFLGGASSNMLSANFRHNRYYRMRIRNNPYNAISITLNREIPYDYDDNVVFNSEISGNLAALYAVPDGEHVNGVKLFNNVIPDRIVRGTRTFTIGEYERAYPALASGNTPGPQAPELLPLAVVTQGGTNLTTLQVNDARSISDGNRMVPGDMLTVGSKVVKCTKRYWDDPTKLDVAPPITVQRGDKIYLQAWGVAAQPLPPVEPELPPPAEPEQPPPTPPTHQPVVVEVQVRVLVNGVEYTVNPTVALQAVE